MVEKLQEIYIEKLTELYDGNKARFGYEHVPLVIKWWEFSQRKKRIFWKRKYFASCFYERNFSDQEKSFLFRGKKNVFGNEIFGNKKWTFSFLFLSLFFHSLSSREREKENFQKSFPVEKGFTRKKKDDERKRKNGVRRNKKNYGGRGRKMERKKKKKGRWRERRKIGEKKWKNIEKSF